MEIFKEIITAAITVIASGKNEVTEMLRKKQSMYKQRKKRRTWNTWSTTATPTTTTTTFNGNLNPVHT